MFEHTYGEFSPGMGVVHMLMLVEGTSTYITVSVPYVYNKHAT